MPKSKTNNFNLAKRLNFNKGQLIAIIVAGVAIGGYVAFKTFAFTGPAYVTGCQKAVGTSMGPSWQLNFTVRRNVSTINLTRLYTAKSISPSGSGYALDSGTSIVVAQDTSFNSNNRAYLSANMGGAEPENDPYWEVHVLSPTQGWSTYAHHRTYLPDCSLPQKFVPIGRTWSR